MSWQEVAAWPPRCRIRRFQPFDASFYASVRPFTHHCGPIRLLILSLWSTGPAHAHTSPSALAVTVLVSSGFVLMPISRQINDGITDRILDLIGHIWRLQEVHVLDGSSVKICPFPVPRRRGTLLLTWSIEKVFMLYIFIYIYLGFS